MNKMSKTHTKLIKKILTLSTCHGLLHLALGEECVHGRVIVQFGLEITLPLFHYIYKLFEEFAAINCALVGLGHGLLTVRGQLVPVLDTFRTAVPPGKKVRIS